MKTLLVLYDVHLTTASTRSYKLVKKFMKDLKPDETIIGGDFMDVSSLSAWDESKARKMEGRRYEKEIATAREELSYIERYSKRITYIEGNHEYRVERYLDKHPEMEGLIEIPERLDLAKKGIRWVEYDKLYKVGRLYFAHGCYWNKHFALKTVQNYGCCIVVGHTHRFQVATIFPKMQKEPWVCYGLGCLGDLDPDFLNGKPSSHLHQFAVAYVTDDGHFNLYPINITDNQFVWNGKQYK